MGMTENVVPRIGCGGSVHWLWCTGQGRWRRRTGRQPTHQAAPEQTGNQVFDIPDLNRAFFDSGSAMGASLFPGPYIIFLGFVSTGEPGHKAIIACDVAARRQCVRFMQKVKADLAGEGLGEMRQSRFMLFKRLR